jgi:hypothetical protein
MSNDKKLLVNALVRNIEDETERLFANANRFLEICTYLRENADILTPDEVRGVESWLRHTNLSAQEILIKVFEKDG